MKAAFGLAGLLITVGIIVWLMSISVGRTSQALHESKTMQDTIVPMTGRNADGSKIADTITLEQFTPPGSTKATGLLVSRVDPANVLATRYGLRQFDVITQVGPILVRDELGTAEAMVQEAAGRGYELKVTRGDQQLTLPQPGGAAAPATPGQPGNPQPAPPPSGATNPLQRQLEGIQKIPTH